MTEYMVGGRRRIDRVLAPDFLEGIDRFDMDELRTRKAEAEQEETDLSYARRLVQGRLDILRAEHAARERGEAGLAGRPPGQSTDAELAERLAKALADPPRQSRGLGRHLSALRPSRVGENRREAERAVSDVGSSNLAHLEDAELLGAIANLADVEARLSRSRRQVQNVVDRLTGEIARRYQAGHVPIALP